MNTQDVFPTTRPAESPMRLEGNAAFSNAVRVGTLLHRLCALQLFLVAATWLAALAGARHPALAPDAAILLLARAALMVSLSGLLATTLVVAARARTLRGRPASVVRAAGSPQALLLCLGAALAFTTLRQAARLASPAVTTGTLLVPVILLLAAFLLLIAERAAAAIDPASLPEARALSTLLRLPVIVFGALALLCVAVARMPGVGRAGELAIGLLVAAGAAETALRTLKIWYAPPPSVSGARASVGSLVTGLLDPRRLSPATIGASLNRNFGIDFARSWALSFARRCALPVLALLLCVCWGLSGASRVGLNQRAVYERFGAPVAVLGPGLHLLLPWPLGRARLSEYGILHSITLGDAVAPADAIADRSGAEDVAPASANRLWDQSGNESAYLVARADDGRQSFEAVSVKLRVLYRIGLSPSDAQDALYRTADPAALLRALSDRLLSRILARQTLADVMVESRERLAGTLRGSLQTQLDTSRSGIEIVGLVIEALHPPAGAASAYRAVQAAEIAGGTAIAEEQGRARGTASLALRDANDVQDAARARAAETLQAAVAEQTRMQADERAWQSGGQAFLLERRYADLRLGLGHAPLEIIDARLTARMLDLRAGTRGPPGQDVAPENGPDGNTPPDPESHAP